LPGLDCQFHIRLLAAALGPHVPHFLERSHAPFIAGAAGFYSLPNPE
jgi:hypothetical protein